jgi:hypothetical protein
VARIDSRWVEPALLVGLIGGVALVYTLFALRVGSFQNDEGYYVELTRFVAGHFPGALWDGTVSYKGFQRLDQLLLAPSFLLWRGPTDFTAAHAIQASLFASTALPVWLIARAAGLGRWARLLAAALAIVVPWAVVSTSFLVEPAAYPAFAWALYATWSAAVKPTRTRELLALLVFALAAFTRTQLIGIAPILPIVLIWREWQWGARGQPLSERARSLPLRLLRSYPLLTPIAALCLLALVLYALDALPNSIVVPLTHGYPLPQIGSASDLLGRYRYDLARIAAGTGFVAFALGLGWALYALVRPAEPRRHTLATLCCAGLAGVLLSLLQGGPDERYLLYGAVPVALAFAASLDTAVRSGGLRRGALACVVAATAATILLIDGVTWPLPQGPYDFFTYPADAFYSRVLMGRLSSVHLPTVHPSAPVLLEAAIAIVVLGWVLASRRRRALRPAASILAVAVLALGVVDIAYVEQKYTTSVAAGAGGPNADQRSWVDRQVPAGARVAALSMGLGLTPDFLAIWRTVEYWNSSIDLDAYFGTPGHLPFPFYSEALPLTIGRDGVLRSAANHVAVPRYLLEPRVASVPVGLDAEAVSEDPVMLLNLVRLRMPARVDWALGNVSPEGFITAGSPPRAVATIYRSALAGGSRCASFELVAPPGFRGTWPYQVVSDQHVLRSGGLRQQQGREITVPLRPTRLPGGETGAELEIRVDGEVPFTNGSVVSASLDTFKVINCPTR